MAWWTASRPPPTDRERQLCAQDFGIEDNWPVYCEEFIQWVLEDKFCNGRPELEAAGVQFVPDVTPFEFMKIRILNGGHAAIAYPASLLDVHFVHDAMNHPLVGAFFAKIEREEIMPTVPPVPGVVLEDYYHLIHRRFSNPKIGDTIPRLAFDGSNRQPKFIVPVARDRLKAGGSIDCAGLRSRPCGAATASARPRPARTSPRATRSGRASPNLRPKPRPIRWPGCRWMTSMATSASRRFSARPSRSSLGEIWSKGTERALADFVGA